jgi:hypothetical protein
MSVPVLWDQRPSIAKKKGGSGHPFSISVLTFSLRGDVNQVAERSEARQGLSLELPDALARQVELVADRLERPGLALEAEPQLEDAPLPLRKGIERPAHALAAERLLGLLERIGGLAIGEEIAELALVVGADRLVQRDRGVGGSARRRAASAASPGQLSPSWPRGRLDLEPPRARQPLARRRAPARESSARGSRRRAVDPRVA